MSDASPRFSPGERAALSLLETATGYRDEPTRLSPAEIRIEIARAIIATVVVSCCVLAVLLR